MYLDESLDELLRVPSTKDIAADFAYGASFQRHTGEVQGLITDLRDELHAETDAWSEQLQQIPEIPPQGTKNESPERSFQLHIAGKPATSEIPLEVRPPRRQVVNPPVGPGPPNLRARARGQVVQPPAPGQAVGVGQVPVPQPALQIPPVGGGAQAAAQVPPVAGPRINLPHGQNPGMANPQARLQQDIAQLVQALTQMANQGQIQGQPQQRGFHTATLLPRDAFSGLDTALARAHWANFQGYVIAQRSVGNLPNFPDVKDMFCMMLTYPATTWFATIPPTINTLELLRAAFLKQYNPWGRSEDEWEQAWDQLQFVPNVDTWHIFQQDVNLLGEFLGKTDGEKLQKAKHCLPSLIRAFCNDAQNWQQLNAKVEEYQPIFQQMTAVPQTAKGQPSTVLTVQPGAAQAVDNDWEKLAKNAVQCLQTMAQQVQQVPECATSVKESFELLPRQTAQLLLQNAQPLEEKLDRVLAMVESKMTASRDDQTNVQDSQDSIQGPKWENAPNSYRGGGCG